MSESLEHKLTTWAIPAVMAALLTVIIGMMAFLLSRAIENGKNIAVITQIVLDGRTLREENARINTAEHKQIFIQLATLVTQPELNLRLSEIRAQMALLEAAVKALDVQLAGLKVEFTALQLEVKQFEERKK
jgi:hypothetical protein